MRRRTSRTPGSRRSSDGPAAEAEATKRGPLRDDLKRAAERGRRWRAHDGSSPCVASDAGGRTRREERDVEKARRERGDGEAPLGVEGGHAERGRAHEEDVRKDGARERDGALELAGRS